MNPGTSTPRASRDPAAKLDNKMLHTHTDTRKLVWSNAPIIPLEG